MRNLKGGPERGEGQGWERTDVFIRLGKSGVGPRLGSDKSTIAVAKPVRVPKNGHEQVDRPSQSSLTPSSGWQG